MLPFNLLPMSLLSMSFSGTVMILVITVIRSATIHKLPKATFNALWGIVLLRLLIPISIPSTYSIYTFARQLMPAELSTQGTVWQPIPNTQQPDTTQRSFPALEQSVTSSGQNTLSAEQDLHFLEKNLLSAEQDLTIPDQYSSIAMPDGIKKVLPVSKILWLVGMAGCILFYAASYIKCMRVFSMSLPVDNTFTRAWQDTHKTKRQILFRQSSFIAAPLTYGILHPVILLPKYMDWENPQQIQYIFAHEYIHIRRFDAVYKLLLTATCCIHWFNPFVWIMYLLANRDMELSCDEAVVHLFGEADRSAYATALICMEETKSRFAPLCSRFSKNAIEERITAIMKTKKNTISKTTAACILISAILFVFATSANAAPQNQASASDTNLTPVSDTNFSDKEYQKLAPVPDTNFSNKEYQKLAALCFSGYRDMTVAAYRTKVWNIIDTDEYMDLLDRFFQDETLNSLKDSNPTANFLFYILEPLTAEKWRSRNFDGYVRTTCENAADDATFEYSFCLTIKNAKKLTIGEYVDTRIQIHHAIEEFFHKISLDELKDEKRMKTAIKSQTTHFESDFCPDTISVKMTDWYYSPLAVYEENEINSSQTSHNQLQETLDDKKDEKILVPSKQYKEPREFPNGSKQDYARILALKTDDYKDCTVEDFNAALLECVNAIDQEHLEGIWEDIRQNDYKVTLSKSELSFLQTTYTFSNCENAEMIKSMYKNIPEGPIWLSKDLGVKYIENHDSWCTFWYQFCYKIPDKGQLTVMERDQALQEFQDELQIFWAETSLNDLLDMSKEDVVSYMKKTASKYSSKQIIIEIDTDQVQFEHDKGPTS